MRRHQNFHLLIKFRSFGQNLIPKSQVSSTAIPSMQILSSSSRPSSSSQFNLHKLRMRFTVPISTMPFCSLSLSDSLILDQSSSCTSTDGMGEHLASLSDKILEYIMANSGSDQSLERSLDSLGLELTTKLVNDVIRSLRYEEKLAFRFFTWAGHQQGYTHERDTYNDMIEILSSTKYKVKQFGVICDILDYMKRREKKSVPIEALLTILKAYAAKHLVSVKKFPRRMRFRKKIQPEIDAFNLLLDSLCKCSLVSEAEMMFHRVKNRVIPNAETYSVLFFGWCRVRDPKKAMEVLEEMIQMGHTPENFTYNAAIDSFCSVGMVSEARELFEFMRTKGSTISSPTAKTYCVMILALAKSDMMDECFVLFDDMRKSGCLPDVSTYKELIEGMCLFGKLEAAYKILEDMGNKGYPPDILTYNCFVKVLCNLKKPDKALGLCEKMIEVGCEPSVHTYHMLMTMFFEMGDPERATDMWHEMDKRGCTWVVDTYCVMIDGLFGCGKAEDACFLLDEVINKGMKLPYQKFDALMSRLSETGNLRAIHRLSDHMRRFYNVAMARRFSVSQKKKSMSLRRT